MTTYKDFNATLLQSFLSEVKSIASKITFNSGMGIDDMKKVDILKVIIPIYNRLKEHPAIKINELDNELMPHIKAQATNSTNAVQYQMPSAPPAYDENLYEDKDPVSSPDSEEIQSFLDMFNGDESESSSDEEELEFDKDVVENMKTTTLLELKHIRNNKWYISQPIDDDCDSDSEFEEQETESESEDEVDEHPDNGANIPEDNKDNKEQVSEVDLDSSILEAGVLVQDAELFSKLDFKDKIGFFNNIEQKFREPHKEVKPKFTSLTRTPIKKEKVFVPQSLQTLYVN